MSIALKSVLYSAIAAAASAAVAKYCPPAYMTLAAGGLGLILLNLRNAWHLPADTKAE